MMRRGRYFMLGLIGASLMACQAPSQPQVVPSLDLPSVYRRLAHAGFDPGPYTLKDFTQLTQAVQQFQRFARLPVHGVIDAQTWAQLQQLDDPAPAPMLEASPTDARSQEIEKSTVSLAPPTPAAKNWRADESMMLYFEAITQLRKKALSSFTSREIVQRTLQSYLRSLDPFSDYLSPQEYLQYKKTQLPQYAGVGMDIQRVASGRILCTPYPDGPAARAGILAGDILEAVNGRPLTDQSLLAVSAQIRGQKGTQVSVTIVTPDGTSRTTTITRAPVRARSVLVQPGGPLPVLQILTFTKETVQELQSSLMPFKHQSALIIDLRGNPGGVLSSAMDAAKLFLVPHQPVAGLQTQGGITTYRKESSTPPVPVKLYLWQDAYTASAAEVFIAALTYNQRAVSIGKKTFGKGTVQEIIALQDGSALYLTTGTLLTPVGTGYHQQGLDPTYPLAMEAAKREDYMARVTVLLQHQTFKSGE